MSGQSGTYQSPPPKPRGWSEKRYREVHDSTPCVLDVEHPDGCRLRLVAAGPVSDLIGGGSDLESLFDSLTRTAHSEVAL
jgi:hypothetical protein